MTTEVALFVTCLVDQLAPDAGVAAVRLLEAAGCRVAFPEAQSCCGQPALNTGEPEAAAVLARHFVEVFEPYEAVVTPSGSCADCERMKDAATFRSLLRPASWSWTSRWRRSSRASARRSAINR